MTEPQQHPQPPQEQQQQQVYAQYTHPDPQQPQPYDPNQQQAAAPYDPSYEAHYAAYYQQQQQYYDPNAYGQHQQQQQYYDYAQAYPHLQPDQTQIHPQQFLPASCHHYPPPHPEANRGGRRGGGPAFRGHGFRGGRHGRGRGRGGGRNPGRFAPAVPPPPKLPVLKIWCDICRVECSSSDVLEQHKNGKRHKKTVQKFEEMQKQQKMFAEFQANAMPGTMYPNGYQANALPSAVHATGYQPETIMPGTMHTGGYHPANAIPNAVQTSGYQQEYPSANTMASTSVICNAPEVEEQKNVPSVPVSCATAEVSYQTADPAKASETADSTVQVDDANKSHNVGSGQNSEANVATTEGKTEFPSHVNHNQLDARKGSIKRKPTRYGRGGKKLKKCDPRYVPERPRVCTLCNVTCETQMGFDTHIAGKKHNSKLKRPQNHGAVFGPITVYIPPNQPTAYPIRGPEPLYYGLSSYNMVNQVPFNMEAHTGNLENQDAPLVFTPKENNGLEINVDAKGTNHVAKNDNVIESDSNEKNNVEIGNQDAPLVFIRKENDGLVINADVKVTSHVALECESKEMSDAAGANNDTVIKSDSNDDKDNAEKKGDTEMSDTSKIAKDSSLDCDSKEKNSMEAGHDCNVNEGAPLDSELKDNAGSDS